jgi:hypothetical protein
MINMMMYLMILVSVILAGCDGTPSGQTWPLMQPEHSYEVDAWGTNPDLLEFTPKHNPGYFCILAVSGGDKLKAIFCMPKQDAQ